MKQISSKWLTESESLRNVIITMMTLAVPGFATAGLIPFGQLIESTNSMDPKNSETQSSIPHLGKDRLFLRCSESARFVLFYYDLNEGRYRVLTRACSVQQASSAVVGGSPIGAPDLP